MMVDCRCPCCKTVHKMRLEKKLNIIPWFYCKICVHKSKRIPEDVLPTTNFITHSELSRIGSE